MSPLSGNRICHLTFKRGFDHHGLFRRGLEILLVQLHADAVALPHDDRRACTGHADDGGSAQNAGLALDALGHGALVQRHLDLGIHRHVGAGHGFAAVVGERAAFYRQGVGFGSGVRCGFGLLVGNLLPVGVKGEPAGGSASEIIRLVIFGEPALKRWELWWELSMSRPF